MLKLAVCCLVLALCLEISLAGKFKKLIKKTKKDHGDKMADKHSRNPIQDDLSLDDYEHASNPEMGGMIKIANKLRPLLTGLGLLKKTPIKGQKAFCQDYVCPKYRSLDKTPYYEKRLYEATKWVRKSIQAPSLSRKVQHELFWSLFNFIRDNKIKMTVPVITTIRAIPGQPKMKNYTMGFYIPSDVAVPGAYSDSSVFVIEKPQQIIYVHDFGGMIWGEGEWKKHLNVLESALEKDIKEKKKNVSFVRSACVWGTAGYNKPERMFNRHNEVWMFYAPPPKSNVPSAIPPHCIAS